MVTVPPPDTPEGWLQTWSVGICGCWAFTGVIAPSKATNNGTPVKIRILLIVVSCGEVGVFLTPTRFRKVRRDFCAFHLRTCGPAPLEVTPQNAPRHPRCSSQGGGPQTQGPSAVRFVIASQFCRPLLQARKAVETMLPMMPCRIGVRNLDLDGRVTIGGNDIHKYRRLSLRIVSGSTSG